MQMDHELTAEDRANINPTRANSIAQALTYVENPVQCCRQVLELIKMLVELVNIKKDDPKTKDSVLYQ